MANLTDKEILRISLENYKEYLKHWHPNLSEEEIQTKSDYFSEIFLCLITNNPYKFKIDNKKYMLIEVRDLFLSLKNEKEPKRVHDILNLVINACYSTDIKPKSAKTVLYLQYAPLMDLLVFVVSVLFTIVFSFVKWKLGF